MALTILRVLLILLDHLLTLSVLRKSGARDQRKSLLAFSSTKATVKLIPVISITFVSSVDPHATAGPLVTSDSFVSHSLKEVRGAIMNFVVYGTIVFFATNDILWELRNAS
jgi:hypothetical protein